MHINLNPFPTLTSARLQLRPLNMSDSINLMQLRSNEQVNKYLDRPAATEVADAEAFITKIDGYIKAQASVYWAINLKENPALIGTICLWNFDPEKNMAEVGYELLPEYQGQGLMHEALAEVIRYSFDMIQLNVIAALTLPANEGSVKLLTRSRFLLDEKQVYVSEEDAEGQSVYFLTNPH